MTQSPDLLLECVEALKGVSNTYLYDTTDCECIGCQEIIRARTILAKLTPEHLQSLQSAKERIGELEERMTRARKWWAYIKKHAPDQTSDAYAAMDATLTRNEQAKGSPE